MKSSLDSVIARFDARMASGEKKPVKKQSSDDGSLYQDNKIGFLAQISSKVFGNSGAGGIGFLAAI